MTDLATINRFAVVLIPTEAYLDWAKSCPDGEPTMQLDEMQEDPTAFLIPESEGELDKYLRRYYRAIFEEELDSWCTDPTFWPKDLSFQNFKKFFTIHISTMVFDLGKGWIIRDDGED